jgi:hypothetical protein
MWFMQRQRCRTYEDGCDRMLRSSLDIKQRLEREG